MAAEPFDPSTTVLLFDIDGTLIDSGGAGGATLLAALQAEFGVADPRPVPLHGRTDFGIIGDLLEQHGVQPTAENRLRLIESYCDSLPRALAGCQQGRVLPGVEALLQALCPRDDCHVGVLTGNMSISATHKLVHFGLDAYFAFGIYGDHVRHRVELAEPALLHVTASVGAAVSAERVVIIGDTPMDVQLAQAMGARSLAVLTGGIAPDELYAAGASHVVDDLTETEAIVQWLLGIG